MYLLDVHLFTPADIEKSSIAFSWPKNIEPIFMHNALLIEKANNEKQAALREKREVLIADIEKEQVRLSEFDECGDYDSIKNYVADCTALSKRLQQYAITIEAINREESLFKESEFLFPKSEFLGSCILLDLALMKVKIYSYLPIHFIFVFCWKIVIA